MTTHPLPFGTLDLPAIHPACRLIVTIPAKDEAGFITETLAALYDQCDETGKPIDRQSYEVIILANNCKDETAGVCRAYGSDHPDFRLHVVERRLPAAIACVGTARRLMMDTALLRFGLLERPTGVICTTDADTRVHREWVYHTLKSIDRGARAVGGRILVPTFDRAADPRYRKYHLRDVTYRSLQYCLESMIDPCRADPWPRHFQHFGPSTAVTAEAYERCGGIPPLKSLEDVNFFRALERVNVSITHNRDVKVYTSSRISHRVDGTAFSHQLDEWAGMSAAHRPQRVIGVENCRRLFKWKVALRHAVERGLPTGAESLQQLADTLGWTFEDLTERIDGTPSFGTLYQEVRLRLEACERFAGTDIERAISDLRECTSSLRHRSFGIAPAGNDRPGQTEAA